MVNPSVAQLRPEVGYGRLLLPALSRSWWALALRGLLAGLFGLAVFLLSSPTFTSLLSFFGLYALGDGALAIIAAARMSGERWWLLLEGVTGVSVGGLALFWAGLTTPALLYCVAAWAVVTGFFEITGAVRLRREIEVKRALVFGGVASVIFGLVLAVLPGINVLSFLWLIGVYALVFGASLVILALRVHRRQSPPAREAGPWLRSTRRGRSSGAAPRGRSRSERPAASRTTVRRGVEDPIVREEPAGMADPVGRGSEAPGERSQGAPTTASARCQRIKSNGERCKGTAVRGSDWCAVHHPDYQEKRRQNAAKKKAKKTGGRGKLPSSSDLNEVQDLIRSTLLGVYQGKIDRSVGMAMFQGCGVLLQTIETQKKLVELEESMERLEAEPDEQGAGGGKRRLGQGSRWTKPGP